jgi:hypothetical protein
VDFEQISKNALRWMPEHQIGYYEVVNQPYDENYFQRYVSYEGSEIAERLNHDRVALVKKYFDGRVLDIGIGSGAFVNAHGNCDGYDVNPAGIRWLKDRRLYCEPSKMVEAMTFWDSFEHIKNPAEVLKYVKKWAFISLPLFENEKHVLKSKHYRKDEHYWYFTFEGLIKYMGWLGFVFIEFNKMEIEAGREDIGTFVFKRKMA